MSGLYPSPEIVLIFLHGNDAFYALLTEAYPYFLSEFCGPFHERMFSSLRPSTELFLHGINALMHFCHRNIHNFLSNSVLLSNRNSFPLPVGVGSDRRTSTRTAWIEVVIRVIVLK